VEKLWRIGPGLVGALQLVGIVTGLGVTRAVGCTAELPWVVLRGPFESAPPWSQDPLNVALSAVLLAFECLAALSSRRIALGLMTVELLGFVAFLFFLKGGYAVGYAGTAIPQVMEYDALSLAIRVASLGLLAYGKEPDRRRLSRVALLGFGAAFLIVAVKAAAFPMPAW
jgi:hypothetical protein